MDIELRNGTTQHPPSTPVEFCMEEHLAHHLAEAYALKLTDKESFETARNSGMAEVPSSLAIRARLLLFKNESEQIKHKKFLENPSFYESSIGKVYCDAGNWIYARIVKEREQAIVECNPTVALLHTNLSKGDLVEVVLYQYRHNQKPQSAQLLAHLEQVIEGALLEVHGADASSTSNDSLFSRLLRCWSDGCMIPSWIHACMNGNRCAWMDCHHFFTQYWNCCGHRGLD